MDKNIKLLLATVGVSILVVLFGFGMSPAVILGAMLIVTGLLFHKQLGLKKDMYKWGAVIVGLVLVVGFLPSVNTAYDNAIGGITGVFGGLGTAAVTTPGTIDSTTIITTTGQITVAAEEMLNRTPASINPSAGWYKDGEAYTSLSFSSGKATISSLDPYTTIDRISAGQDNLYYWVQEDNVALNGKLSYPVSMKFVRVPTASTVKIYNSLYSEVTNGTGTNQSVGSGGSVSGFLRYEITSASTGLRAPAICIEYATGTIDRVDMAGLSEITANIPTRLITTSQGRTLAQCFDSGFTWITDAGAKPGITGAGYGYKDFGYTVRAVAGQDPAHGTNLTFYMIDRDEYYRRPAGVVMFVNPDDTTTDLGYTAEQAGYLEIV